MSSSSCARDSVEELLEAALDVLARETPRHAELLALALGPRDAGLEVDDERLTLRGGEARLRLLRGGSGAGLRARLDLETLHALVDERLGILRALGTRRLEVYGTIDELSCAWEACRVLLHGLVRAPSGAALLDDLRRLARRRRSAC